MNEKWETTMAERWHAAQSPIELHADPWQIVIEGVHSNGTGEWGKRFCLHEEKYGEDIAAEKPF
jgi:hypothetical protein